MVVSKDFHVDWWNIWWFYVRINTNLEIELENGCQVRSVRQILRNSRLMGRYRFCKGVFIDTPLPKNCAWQKLGSLITPHCWDNGRDNPLSNLQCPVFGWLWEGHRDFHDEMFLSWLFNSLRYGTSRLISLLKTLERSATFRKVLSWNGNISGSFKWRIWFFWKTIYVGWKIGVVGNFGATCFFSALFPPIFFGFFMFFVPWKFIAWRVRYKKRMKNQSFLVSTRDDGPNRQPPKFSGKACGVCCVWRQISTLSGKKVSMPYSVNG